jgi:hypothetical protein
MRDIMTLDMPILDTPLGTLLETARLLDKNGSYGKFIDGPAWAKKFFFLKRKYPCFCTDGSHLTEAAKNNFHAEWDGKWLSLFKKYWMLSRANKLTKTVWFFEKVCS